MLPFWHEPSPPGKPKPSTLSLAVHPGRRCGKADTVRFGEQGMLREPRELAPCNGDEHGATVLTSMRQVERRVQ
jgi:hypothetical protein